MSRIILPANKTETYQQHFTNNSWTSPQDAITAGYPYFLQPVPNPAQYIQTIYYGAVAITSSQISLSFLQTAINGTVTVTPKISTSLDGSSWTDFAGVTQAYGTNFRYVKITLDAVPSDNKALCAISNIEVKLSLKNRTDQGNDSVSNASTGKSVNFNLAFLKVDAIEITPAYQAGISIASAYSFDHTANPAATSFTVYLYNSTTGTKITGNFAWTARGA